MIQMRRYLVVSGSGGDYKIQQTTDDLDDARMTQDSPGLCGQSLVYCIEGVSTEQRSNLLPRPTDEKDGKIWDLHMELERLRVTLHDRYVMAAITGLCALQGREPHRIGELVTAARAIADKAIAERG